MNSVCARAYVHVGGGGGCCWGGGLGGDVCVLGSERVLFLKRNF
jgi:hypothetical protein